MEQLIFTIIFIVTIGSACVVAFSKNLIYSAFALIGTFLGVAATFILLHADFVGLVQVVVYAGGILVLIIFAVMLTSKIQSGEESNPVINFKIAIPVFSIFIFLLLYVLTAKIWTFKESIPMEESRISEIGNLLLTDYLLPFELVSVVMLAVIVAAAIITRRHVK